MPGQKVGEKAATREAGAGAGGGVVAGRRDVAQMGPAPVRWPVIYAQDKVLE